MLRKNTSHTLPTSRKRSFEVPSRRKANKVAKRGTKKYDEATGGEDVYIVW